MRLPEGLLGESEAWLRDGLITAEQRRAILARYEPAETATQQASAVLTWLAVILAGVGAVVLAAWNWTAIPVAVKVLLIVGPMVGLYAAAAIAARRRREVIAERLALLAALFAGAVIFLTNDVLHVDPQRTYSLLLWAGVLAATAALTPSALIAAVGTAVAAWWIIQAGGMPPAPWWVLPIWPALALAVERVPNRWVAGGVTLAFGYWVFFIMLGVWPDVMAVPAVGAVLAGNWMYTLTQNPESRPPAFARATPALVLTLFGLGLLLPSGTHRGTDDWHSSAERIWPAATLLAALAIGTGLNVSKTGAWRSRPAGLTILAALWLILWFTLPADLRASAALQWTWTVIFSGAMIHLAAAAVRDASRARDVGQLIVGLLSVLIFVIVRVVDARSLVVSGLMLIGSAALLWWLARLWVRPSRTGGRP